VKLLFDAADAVQVHENGTFRIAPFQGAGHFQKLVIDTGDAEFNGTSGFNAAEGPLGFGEECFLIGVIGLCCFESPDVVHGLRDR
jgi:hypothetical protein